MEMRDQWREVGVILFPRLNSKLLCFGGLNTSGIINLTHQTIKTRLAYLLPISLDAVFRAKAWRWRKMRETLEPD